MASKVPESGASGERKGVLVTFKEGYALLQMKSGENRFNVEFVEELHSALDEVERNQNIKFLITVGTDKFYSNGLDLERLASSGAEYMIKFVRLFNQLLTRILTFPLVTVAAMNGHAFAGGALLALAHDYRVMRIARGWFCFPEIHLKLRFQQGMYALLRRKIPNPAALTDAVLIGKRFTAEDALSSGIVQKICDSTELLDTAADIGQKATMRQVPDRQHLNTLKCDLFSDVIEAFGNVERSRSSNSESFQASKNTVKTSKL